MSSRGSGGLLFLPSGACHLVAVVSCLELIGGNTGHTCGCVGAREVWARGVKGERSEPGANVVRGDVCGIGYHRLVFLESNQCSWEKKYNAM